MNKHKRLSGGLPCSLPSPVAWAEKAGTLSKHSKDVCLWLRKQNKMDGDMLNENQTKRKEICTDNNLLWGGKAYSFGYSYAIWVDTLPCLEYQLALTKNGFTAFTTRDVNFHYCLVIWKEQETSIGMGTNAGKHNPANSHPAFMVGSRVSRRQPCLLPTKIKFTQWWAVPPTRFFLHTQLCHKTQLLSTLCMKQRKTQGSVRHIHWKHNTHHLQYAQIGPRTKLMPIQA